MLTSSETAYTYTYITEICGGGPEEPEWVSGRGNGRGRGFPRTNILPDYFDRRGKAGEGRGRQGKTYDGTFPTTATSRDP